MAAKKKKVSKKKVSKKKTAKKKTATKKRIRSKTIISKAENEIKENDLVYANGSGKPANGRPSKSAKLSQIKALASIGCTHQEIASIVGMSKDTFTQLKKHKRSYASSRSR